MLIVFFSGIAYAGILQKDSCTPGSTQRCVCPDGTKKEQTCSADGISWEACDCTYYTAWCDEATDLCWQDPQKDYYKEGDDGVEPADAVRYCRNLSFGGYSDWRLPTIAELRTLVRGNPLTVTGGACPMGNESTSADMNDENCGPVDLYEGPGIGGCYWPEELTGSCSRPDVASEGHPLEFASSTRCP
ncbi:MAG: DUF1566 domain-containing protein, partial [Deltaproteobacteria bacterium]|nr:DUF1566 domain-containing protein [Deltaproteobacteria bacterium]